LQSDEKEWEERQEEMAKQIRAKEELLSDEKQVRNRKIIIGIA
jgi:hypothetical protein